VKSSQKNHIGFPIPFNEESKVETSCKKVAKGNINHQPQELLFFLLRPQWGKWQTSLII